MVSAFRPIVIANLALYLTLGVGLAFWRVLPDTSSNAEATLIVTWHINQPHDP
jgi:hypothetical protein